MHCIPEAWSRGVLLSTVLEDLPHLGLPDANDVLGLVLGESADGNVTLLEGNFSADRQGNIVVNVAPYQPTKFMKLQLVVMPLLPDHAARL